MPDPTLIRRAKVELRALVKREPWYRGIAIARRGGQLILRLNVAPNAKDSELPHEFNGIPIEIVRLEGYERRNP
jgi:hypothetical protein